MFRHVLVHPGFRRYFAASSFSNVGTWMQNTAQVLLAYHLTHSALAVGVVVGAQFSSVLFLGPWAAAVAARARSLRGLLIATQAASAAVAITLAVMNAEGMLTVAWLTSGAFALGLAYSFAVPAFAVLVPALVPEEESRTAIAMDSTSYNVCRAAAPLAAVLMVSTVGFGWVFAVNGASFLVLAAGLCIVKPYRVIRPAGASTITEGLQLAAQKRSIRLLLLMVAAVTIAADPVLVLGPAMASHLGVSSDWAGYFLAALGTGIVVGSVIPVRGPSRLLHAAYPLLLAGGAVIAFAGCLSPWACLAMAFVAGVACMLTGSVARKLLFSLAVPTRANAVFVVWTTAWVGSKAAASPVDGLLASHWGVTFAGTLMALPALLSGLVIIFHRSRAAGRIRRTTPRHPEGLPVSASIPTDLAGAALGTAAAIFAKAFIETLGKNAAEGLTKLLKHVRQLVRTRKRRNGKLEEHISTASPIAATVVVTADLPDEAHLALLDLDVTAEQFRGKLLRWKPDAQAWQPDESD